MGNRFGSSLCLLLAQFACAIAFAAPASAPADRAGVFTIVDGDVRVTPPGGAAHAVKVGDSVSQGDLVATGPGAEAHLRMEDTSYLALRQNSSLRIEKFRADGGDDDTSVLRLISGGIRAVSGWIGKYKPRDVLLHTPSITIGIRGTDHETRIIPEGSAEGEPGTYDRVYAGETVIKSDAGETTVTKDKAGFHPLRARQRARLLASVPGFFRPGPHEAEINRKHEEIQRQIDEKRSERRKAVLERRAALKSSATKTKQMLEENKAAREEAKQAVREGRSTPKAERAAMQERRKALREQVQETREKRKDFQDEKASATEEIKGLRREEAKRYRQELKADRKAAPAAPADKP